MVSYDKLYEDVRQMLSEKRFKHSEGVVKRVIEYAQIYGIDIEVAKCTAIAHDIAKELTEEQENEYIKKYNIVLDDVEKENHNLVHAKLGAEICKYEYGFSEDMVNSVKTFFKGIFSR